MMTADFEDKEMVDDGDDGDDDGYEVDDYGADDDSWFWME